MHGRRYEPSAAKDTGRRAAQPSQQPWRPPTSAVHHTVLTRADRVITTVGRMLPPSCVVSCSHPTMAHSNGRSSTAVNGDDDSSSSRGAQLAFHRHSLTHCCQRQAQCSDTTQQRQQPHARIQLIHSSTRPPSSHLPPLPQPTLLTLTAAPTLSHQPLQSLPHLPSLPLPLLRPSIPPSPLLPFFRALLPPPSSSFSSLSLCCCCLSACLSVCLL